LQPPYSGHNRQRFTVIEPSLAPASVSTKEKLLSSGHRVSFIFSYGLKSALPINVSPYQIRTNTVAAILKVISFIAASFLVGRPVFFHASFGTTALFFWPQGTALYSQGRLAENRRNRAPERVELDFG
jgi:hypothetical protein